MFRRLVKNDYHKKYLNLLEQTNMVGFMQESTFHSIFNNISSNPFHHIFVYEHKNKIIASGTLIIETKFISTKHFSGHITNIVVDKNYRTYKQLKIHLIKYLLDYSKKLGCYKCFINSEFKNEINLQKLGFHINNFNMVKYF